MSDAALERSAVSKASWRLLPLIGLGYGVSYIDRVNISFAALQMNRDLGFSATVYGLGAGLFFLGYALCEVPSNMILVRVGARRWIARIMLTWGALAIGMLFVRTPVQFYVMRFLLGVAEAGFFPGVAYYLTLWFPEAHRGRAISRFYVAWPLSTVVMGAVAGALLGLQGRLGLAGWQWLFLVEGAPALLLSVVILLRLPDSPEQAAWLTDGEKAWLRRRLAGDAAALAGAPQDALRAVTSLPVLTATAVNFLLLGGFYAFNLSAPELLRGATGMSAGEVGYLVAAGGLLGAVALLLNGWHSDHSAERHLHLVVPILVMAAAFAVIGQAAAPWAVAGAYVVALVANAAVGGVVWPVLFGVLHPRTAAVGSATINALGQLGSFVLPALWGVSRDATGGFHAGLAVLPFAYLLAAGLVFSLRQSRMKLAAAPA
ncbi:MAG: MFS transporter [Caulobacterales bacterium]|nr:MFS transporter [Caulobacterales bacterium]